MARSVCFARACFIKTRFVSLGAEKGNANDDDDRGRTKERKDKKKKKKRKDKSEERNNDNGGSGEEAKKSTSASDKQSLGAFHHLAPMRKPSSQLESQLGEIGKSMGAAPISGLGGVKNGGGGGLGERLPGIRLDGLFWA